ncbi:MAG: ABC transporter permease [Coriobacteriales bacterium]|jgi:ABC-2 type transport system permease protein
MEKTRSNNWSVFWAMVQRDLIAQWRDKGEFVFRVVMLPTVLIIVYGYVLPKIGLLPSTFPTQMFAGMIGMSIIVTGIHGTAVPLTMDFNNMHEIEDRLQAPVSANLVALAKMFVGIIEAFIGALLVLPISAIFMGGNVDFTITTQSVLMLIPILLLIALVSATLGLLVGTIVKPMQVAAMFPGFLMPLVFTGAIFFSWKSLTAVPVFQILVLVNPMVYANEALRYVLTPQIDSMALWISIIGLIVSILILGYFGFKRFHNMVTGK